MKKLRPFLLLEAVRACAFKSVFFCLSFGLITGFHQPVFATQTWTGLANSDNWSANLNWSGGAAPTNNGTADLTFGGPTSTHPLTPFTDINWNIDGLTYSSNAVAFVNSGLQLTLQGGG